MSECSKWHVKWYLGRRGSKSFCRSSEAMLLSICFFFFFWPGPNLEDASKIPSIRQYICWQTRLIDGIFAWKRGCLASFQELRQSCLFTSELQKMASTVIRRRNSWISEDWTEEIKENTKNIAPWMLSTFSRGYPETVPRNRQKFRRTSMRRQPP